MFFLVALVFTSVFPAVTAVPPSLDLSAEKEQFEAALDSGVFVTAGGSSAPYVTSSGALSLGTATGSGLGAVWLSTAVDVTGTWSLEFDYTVSGSTGGGGEGFALAFRSGGPVAYVASSTTDSLGIVNNDGNNNWVMMGFDNHNTASDVDPLGFDHIFEYHRSSGTGPVYRWKSMDSLLDIKSGSHSVRIEFTASAVTTVYDSVTAPDSPLSSETNVVLTSCYIGLTAQNVSPDGGQEIHITSFKINGNGEAFADASDLDADPKPTGDNSALLAVAVVVGAMTLGGIGFSIAMTLKANRRLASVDMQASSRPKVSQGGVALAVDNDAPPAYTSRNSKGSKGSKSGKGGKRKKSRSTDMGASQFTAAKNEDALREPEEPEFLNRRASSSAKKKSRKGSKHSKSSKASKASKASKGAYVKETSSRSASKSSKGSRGSKASKSKKKSKRNSISSRNSRKSLNGSDANTAPSKTSRGVLNPPSSITLAGLKKEREKEKDPSRVSGLTGISQMSFSGLSGVTDGTQAFELDSKLRLSGASGLTGGTSATGKKGKRLSNSGMSPNLDSSFANFDTSSPAAALPSSGKDNAPAQLVNQRTSRLQLRVGRPDLYSRGSLPKTGRTAPRASGRVSQAAPQWAKVTSAFAGRNDNELTLAVGEVVKVLDEDETTGWWLGAVDGEEGLFPSSCVEWDAPRF